MSTRIIGLEPIPRMMELVSGRARNRKAAAKNAGSVDIVNQRGGFALMELMAGWDTSFC